MRTATFAVAIAFILLPGPVRSDSPKPLPADVGSGRIAWFDITTSSLALSQEFYGKLFDWKFAAVKGSDMALEIVAGDAGIGTLRVAEGDVSPFNGIVYVQVPDILASCSKAKDLGGSVAPGFPFDLPDGIGSVAVALDPVGHPVGMYSRTPLAPTEPPAK